MADGSLEVVAPHKSYVKSVMENIVSFCLHDLGMITRWNHLVESYAYKILLICSLRLYAFPTNVGIYSLS